MGTHSQPSCELGEFRCVRAHTRTYTPRIPLLQTPCSPGLNRDSRRGVDCPGKAIPR